MTTPSTSHLTSRSGGAPDLVRGDQVGPGRRGALEHLALQPLQGPGLPVPHRHVVDHRVPGDGRLGLGRRGPVHRPADDHAELDLPVDLLAHRRQHQVVPRAGQGVGELGEQRRVLRQVPPGLQDVRPVVQPHADDLARPRHDRREVRLGGRHRRRALPRPPEPARGEHLAHVGRVQRDQHVPVQPRRGRPVLSPDGRQSHSADYSAPPRGPGSGALHQPGSRPRPRQ